MVFRTPQTPQLPRATAVMELVWASLEFLMNMTQLLKRSWFVPLACGVSILASPLMAQDKAEKSDKSAKPEEEGPMVVPVSPKLSKLNDFHDMKFGTPFSEFKDLKLSQDRGPFKLYTSDSDKQLFGPVLLEEIVYYFFQDKFAGVGLHTVDGNDTSNAIRIMEKAFGPGTAIEGESTYVWKGEKVSLRISVNDAGLAEILLSNNDLFHAYMEWENTAVEEAAKEIAD